MAKNSRLIITADDFGLWPEVNDAVIAGYESGIVSSASLRVSDSSGRSHFTIRIGTGARSTGIATSHLLTRRSRIFLRRRAICMRFRREAASS